VNSLINENTKLVLSVSATWEALWLSVCRESPSRHVVGLDRVLDVYAGISSRMSLGSSPSHAGFSAVLSKIDEVLNGSK